MILLNICKTVFSKAAHFFFVILQRTSFILRIYFPAIKYTSYSLDGDGCIQFSPDNLRWMMWKFTNTVKLDSKGGTFTFVTWGSFKSAPREMTLDIHLQCSLCCALCDYRCYRILDPGLYSSAEMALYFNICGNCIFS